MTRDEIRAYFSNLRVFEQDGQRALNKPMMVLWAIGKCFAEPNHRLIPYKNAKSEYSVLMSRFGHYSTSTHPEYPFWRLRGDGIWDVEKADLVKQNLTGAGDARPRFLEQHGIRAGFTKPVHRAFVDDPGFAVEIADLLVEAHFGNTSLSDDVLRSAGIPTPTLPRETIRVVRRVRDPQFRPLVLEAYGHKCAVCQTSMSIDDRPIGIEAAHVRWHAEEGIDEVSNGVAMCVRHHSLFDYGAFTLSLAYRIVVAETLDGDAVSDWIGRFNDKQMLRPKRHNEAPHPNNLQWHHYNVFKADPETVQRD